MMEGQIELLDYLAENSYESLVFALAKGLIAYCHRWNYDKIDRLLQAVSEENFIRIFCDITCTYYFEYIDGFYGALIKKRDRIVQFYKCGNNHEKILYECSVQEVVERLAQEYDGKRQGECV